MQYLSVIYLLGILCYKLEMDIFETRRTNLKRLIDDQYSGSYASFADAADTKASQISRFFMDTSNKNARNIGEKTARKIEQALNLQAGQLDQPANLTPENNVVSHMDQRINELGSDYNNKKSKDAGSTQSEDMQRWIATYAKLSSSERASVRAVCDAIIKPEKADGNGNGTK